MSSGLQSKQNQRIYSITHYVFKYVLKHIFTYFFGSENKLFWGKSWFFRICCLCDIFDVRMSEYNSTNVDLVQQVMWRICLGVLPAIFKLRLVTRSVASSISSWSLALNSPGNQCFTLNHLDITTSLQDSPLG